MDKSELREKVLAAMAEAMMSDMFAPHELPLDTELRNKYFRTAAAALDALHGIARVMPVDADDQFLMDCGGTSEPIETDAAFREFYDTITAAGDITQPKDTP